MKGQERRNENFMWNPMMMACFFPVKYCLLGGYKSKRGLRKMLTISTGGTFTLMSSLMLTEKTPAKQNWKSRRPILTNSLAISDLCDFLKCHGMNDSALRLFAVTEVYLRRTKSTLYRKKNIEYSRNLSLESLIAEGSWATLEGVEKVISKSNQFYR